MSCAAVREYLDHLLATGRDHATEADLAVHLDQCPQCSRQRDIALATLARLQPSQTLSASQELKERIMSKAPVATMPVVSRPTKAIRLPRVWRLALATAAVVIFGLSVPFVSNLLRPSGSGGYSALDLYGRVWAAENARLSGDQVVHVTSRIDVLPVADVEMAEARWLPLVSLDAHGQPRFHQLRLAAAPGQAYSVQVNMWFDSREHRFARVVQRDGALVYADSFDGQSLFTAEPDAQGRIAVTPAPVEREFVAPKDMAALSGLLGAMPPPTTANDNVHVTRAGSTTLGDGSSAYLLDVRPARLIPGVKDETHLRLTVREDEHTVVRSEFYFNDTPAFRIELQAVKQGEDVAVGWNLARLGAFAPQVAPAQATLGSGHRSLFQVLKDAVVLDVSVEKMIASLSFEPYVFSENPVWTKERKIAIVMRGVLIAYVADDGRHVVLAQLGHPQRPKTDADRLIHTSPSGVRVWSTSDAKRNAMIAFVSTQSMTGAQPAGDCTAYMVEVPGDLRLILAVNGTPREGEIEGLADHLVPARQLVKP
jgi:hypothetical protein